MSWSWLCALGVDRWQLRQCNVHCCEGCQGFDGGSALCCHLARLCQELHVRNCPVLFLLCACCLHRGRGIHTEFSQAFPQHLLVFGSQLEASGRSLIYRRWELSENLAPLVYLRLGIQKSLVTLEKFESWVSLTILNGISSGTFQGMIVLYYLCLVLWIEENTTVVTTHARMVRGEVGWGGGHTVLHLL